MELIIHGLDELIRKLNGDVLLAKPLREALTKGIITVENEGRERSPVDTGHLRSSLTHRLDARPVPLFAQVGTKVKYGQPLDAPITRTPHYRRGPRKGQPTKGWLSGTLRDSKVAQEIEGYLRDAAVAIEAIWRR